MLIAVDCAQRVVDRYSTERPPSITVSEANMRAFASVFYSVPTLYMEKSQTRIADCPAAERFGHRLERSICSRAKICDDLLVHPTVTRIPRCT